MGGMGEERETAADDERYFSENSLSLSEKRSYDMENECMTNAQFALRTAADIVKTEIKEGWNFSEDGPATVTVRIARQYLDFLEHPDWSD